jgi:hypothetical protein
MFSKIVKIKKVIQLCKSYFHTNTKIVYYINLKVHNYKKEIQLFSNNLTIGLRISLFYNKVAYLKNIY